MSSRNVKNVITLFIMLIALICVFSCSQTLPTQRTVVIERINDASWGEDNMPSVDVINASPSAYWINASDNDSNARFTVFTGSKFINSGVQREFTALSSDGKYYLLYKFDGKTWSDSPRLNHPADNDGQKIFTGNIPQGEGDYKLYAYYTYETYNVAAVEISGEVNIVRFVSIPDNEPKELRIKLNFGNVFDKSKFSEGTELPSDFIIPRVEGLKYSIVSFESDNILRIKITGTPTGSSTDTNNVTIPKKYVQGAEIDLKGEDQNRYIITNPSIDVRNQVIDGYKLKQITKENPKQLKFLLTGGAEFNTDLIKEGSLLKEYSDGFKLGMIAGLEYEVSKVEANELVVSIYGYPLEIKDRENIRFSGIQEKYIKNGSSEDFITDTISSEGSYYDIKDVQITASTPDGVIKLVNGIQIPENDSKVISLKIQTGAKFKPEAVKLDNKVEWSTFTTVSGLSMRFGSLEEDGSLLKILISGTPEFTSSGESIINISVPEYVLEGSSEINGIVVDTSSIKYDKGLVKLSIAKDVENGMYFGTQDYPIQGVSNIQLGNGDGIKVRLVLENATFNTSIADYLDECFAGLQKEFGYTAEEGTYSILAGGEANSGDVVVLIKGSPVNFTKTGLSSVEITLPSKVITQASTSLNNVKGTLYYSTALSSLSVDDSGSYLGANRTSPLVATRGVLIGSTDDKEEVLIKLNLDKAVFKSDISENNIKEWFAPLNASDGWGKDLVYSIIENKPDRDSNGNITGSHIIIKINGTPTSLNSDPSKVDITVPSSAVKGSTSSYENFTLPVWYRVKGSVEARISGYGESAENPIKGTQYVMLSEGDGIYVDIALSGGKFNNVNVGDDISLWFKNWIEDGIENATFRIVSIGAANDLITVLVNGSLNKGSSSGQAYRVPVVVPRSKIKDASLSGDLTAHLYYSAEARIGVELSSEALYYGTAQSPLVGVRGVSMNEGKGADVKLIITNGGKFSKDIAISDIEKWFSSFGELKSPIFSIVRGGKAGDDYIVVHIDGTLMSESTVQKNVTVTMQKSLFNGVLINDLSTTLYYKTTSEVEAEVSANAAYYGSESNPLTGIRYIPLGSSNGEEIKITLKNAKFVNTLKVGDSVKDWFVAFTDITGYMKFTISEVAPDFSYVVIKIQGALSSPVKAEGESDQALISIPRILIDGYLTNNVLTTLHYKTTAEVRASVYSGSGYYGSFEYPIVDTQRVSLNNNEGVLVMINLENAVFNQTVTADADLSTWFSSFGELINSSYTLEAGGQGENYAVIRVKGALITEAKQSKAIALQVPPSAVEGFLPSPLTFPLYYHITNPVTASFDLSGNYKGSYDKPIEGISFVHLGAGEGVEVKINLDGGLFRQDISGSDIASWFSLFTDLSSKEVVIKDRGDYSYISFVLKGTLISAYSDTVKTSSVRIPSSDIQNASFNDDVVVDVTYRAVGVVNATIDETGEYLGAATNPITEIQNNPLGEGDGVFVKINLENGTFNRANNLSLARGESVSSWFTNFTDFSLATYTIEDIGDKYVVIRIKGSITSAPEPDAKSAYISIPSAAIYGSLESNVDTLMYYQTTGSIDIQLDARYAGSSDENPITGVKYIDINNKEGVLVRINLIGAKFATGINKDYDFAPWFEELSPLLAQEQYEYHSGGEREDFVIVRVKGAFITPTLLGSVELKVPSQAIDAPSLTSEYLQKSLYYYAEKFPDASLDEGKDFYGTRSNPISEKKFVYLNNNNGVLIKINLRNALFSSEVVPGSSLASWFTAFTNTIFTPDTEYTVVEGGHQQSFVIVKINGAVIGSSDNKEISIPPSAIDGYLTDPLSCILTVTDPETVSLSLEEGSEYYGYDSNPLKSMQNVLIGAGEGELIRINLTKGEFAPAVVKGYDISSWFTDISASMVFPEYEIVGGGAGENYVIVRVKGAFTDQESTETRNKDINIPAKDVYPYYSLGDSIKGNFVWIVTREDEPQIAADTRYKGGSSTYPISGIRYIALRDGEGEEVKIYINNGSFNALTEEKVKKWFENFDQYLTSSSYRITEGGKDGDSFVVVKITGALTQSRGVPTQVALSIPPEDVKNSSRTTPYQPVLYYCVTDDVQANITSNINGYIGYEGSPLTGYRNIPMNDNNGYLINISISNTVFESHIIKGFNVDSWFDDFTDITHKNYTVEEGGKGKNYVVIRVKGAIQTEDTQKKFEYVKIPANAMVGYLPSFVACPMYYQIEGTVSAAFEKTGYSGGEESSPLSGIQYAPIYTGREEGVKVKVLLSGAKFASSLQSDVSHWFNGFTDFIKAPYGDSLKRSFEIIDGGSGKDYAVILIKGAIITNKETAVIQNVVIPFTDIDGYLDTGIVAKLYYKSSGIITAEVENNAIYYGSNIRPIEGYQYMPLGGGSGLKIKIVLKNTVFTKDIKAGDNIDPWFRNFNAFTSQGAHYTIESGGEGENYVIVTVKGSLSISDTGNENIPSVEIQIPRTAVVASLPSDFTAPLYYRSLGNVVASLDRGEDGKYYGSEINPVEGVAFTDLVSSRGSNIQMRIQLKGAEFKDVDTQTDVSSWFKEWTDSGDIKGIGGDDTQPTFSVKAGGSGNDYVVIDLVGKLIQSSTEKRRVRIEIPKDKITGNLTSSVYATLVYKVSSTVKASVDMKGTYKGSYLYPITGSSALAFSNANRQIHVVLENAVFSEDLTSDSVSEWFDYPTSYSPNVPSSVITTTGEGYKIISNGANHNDVIIEINGGFRDTVLAVNKGYVDLRIPKNHIKDASLNNDIYLTLYYTCLGSVTATLSSDAYFVGDTSNNVLEGIVGVGLNNGNGSYVRLNLQNDVVFNSDIININNPIDTSFSDKIDNINVTIAGGGNGSSFIDLNIKGKPHTPTDPTNITSGEKATISIPLQYIEGCLDEYKNNLVKVDLHYVFYDDDALQLVLKDNDPSYLGSSLYPLSFKPYISFGEGAGVDARFDLVLSRSGRNPGKFEPVFSSSMTDVKIKSCFDTLFESAIKKASNPPIEGSFSTSIVSGGPLQSYVVVRFTGYIVQENISKTPTNILIKDCLAGGDSNLSLSTQMYLETSPNVQVTIAPPTALHSNDWFGTNNAPISGPIKSTLYNMNVRMQLSDADVKFSANLNNDTLAECIIGKLYANYEVDTGVVILRGGSGYDFVEFRIDSTTPLVNQQVTLTSADIVLPYTLISGAVNKPGEYQFGTQLWYQTSGEVKISISDSFTGDSKDKPLKLINLVYLGNDKDTGINTVIEFENVYLSGKSGRDNMSVGEDISSWFENVSQFLDADLEFHVIPLSDVPRFDTTQVTVTTQERAIGYKYDQVNNTYTSYLGVKITGTTSKMGELVATAIPFSVPAVYTNKTQVKTDNMMKGELFAKKENLVIRITEQSGNSGIHLYGSKGIYFGYALGTGLDLRLELDQNQYNDGVRFNNIPSKQQLSDIEQQFKARVNGVYNVKSKGIDNDGKYLKINVDGYPTGYTFSGDTSTSQQAYLNILAKYIKGSNEVFPDEPISTPSYYISVGIPHIQSGLLARIRTFSGMILKNPQPMTIVIFGNAQFNPGSSSYISLNTQYYEDSDGRPYSDGINAPGRPFIVNPNVHPLYVEMSWPGGPGESTGVFKRGLNGLYRVRVSVDPRILRGYVPGVTTLDNNNTYVNVELLDPNDSSYIMMGFDTCTQRTPHPGQDRLMFAYVWIEAPVWNQLGFGLNERMFTLPSTYGGLKPYHNPFGFGSTLQTAMAIQRWGKGSFSEDVERPRGDVTNKWDRYQVDIVDVKTKSFDANDKGFYLRLNAHYNNYIVFDDNYGVGSWSAHPETSTKYLYSKDGDRAKSHYNTGNHKVRGLDWETT
ncbi:MAG: hypothetical protein SPJ08_03490 [Sphaerochaetaceae bacterium]|nr:hypothetical protein [Sphaerochaetaceae bacterium]